MRGLRCVAAAVAAVVAAGQTIRPIIGILGLPNDVPAPFDKHQSYFPASYVKWVESGGGRVVPIPYFLDAGSVKALVKNLNGFLFTGGAASFFEKDGSPTPFAQTANIIFNEVVSAAQNGETLPLWGTCLGHELVLTLASGLNASVMTSGFNSENISWPLYPTADGVTSRLWGTAPTDAYQYLTTENITMNSHQAGISPLNFAGSAALTSTMKVLAIGQDRDGAPFVSSTEGITMPIYTTQFHPEKPLFEWWSSEAINHSYHSIVGNEWTQRFFVNQARLNNRSFPDAASEAAALIYNYNAEYTASVSPGFQQCYFFDPAQ